MLYLLFIFVNINYIDSYSEIYFYIYWCATYPNYNIYKTTTKEHNILILKDKNVVNHYNNCCNLFVICIILVFYIFIVLLFYLEYNNFLNLNKDNVKC